jgi:hypothetical protein
MKKMMIKDLAYPRSGDKGDISNIGLIAFNKKNYDILVKNVTPERIKAFFKDEVKGTIEIFPMPNIEAIQIVMHNALGGGATRTLRLDQTGKSMGCAFLRMEIPVD